MALANGYSSEWKRITRLIIIGYSLVVAYLGKDKDNKKSESNPRKDSQKVC